MAAQRKIVCIRRVEVSRYRLCMNPKSFEALVASSMFDRLPKETQEILNSLMLVPMETASAGGCMVSEGDAPEVVNVEMPAVVPKSPRFPRLKPTLAGGASKMKKEKYKVT